MRARELGCVLILAAASEARAQVQSELLRQVDSALSTSDTIRAIAMLDSAVRESPRSALLWHRLGLLSWYSAGATRDYALSTGRRGIRLLRKADSALRIAARLEPGTARYVLDLGRFFEYSEVFTVRLQAPRQFTRALESARGTGDMLVLSEAADELGMIHWRRYQAISDRRQLTTGAAAIPLDELLRDARSIQSFLELRTVVPSRPSGIEEYSKATDLFHEALRSNPNNDKAVRHSFMALVERGQWPQLLEAASRRLNTSPWDPWAWLAKGLSSWRLHNSSDAAAAYDSALVLLSSRDRENLVYLARILRPSDSSSYEMLTAHQRRVMNRLYWTAADPLALTPENEVHLEFLSRVAEAEFRWSTEDAQQHGSNSDRGSILIRFGPPPIVASFAPTGTSTQACPGYRVDFSEQRQGVETGLPVLESCVNAGDPASSLVIWYYPETGLHFVFRAPPTYGTAHLVGEYSERLREVRAVAPVSWLNVPVTKSVDSLPVMIARFRANTDSSDLLIYADFPTSSTQHTTGLPGQRWRVGVTAIDATLGLIVRDTTPEEELAGQSTAPRKWVVRVPATTMSYRVEGIAAETGAAARASGGIEFPSNSGFGMSDIAVGSRLSTSNPTPRRWNEVHLSGGISLSSGRPFGVLWETYELESESGVSRYQVDLTFSLKNRQAERPLLVRIFEGTTGAIGLRQKQRADEVTITYERTIPSSPVALDYLSLATPEDIAGTYVLSITITDLVARKSVTTVRQLMLQ